MTRDKIAKNLLQDKTCDNCQGWTCPVKGEIVGTCENWKELVDLRIDPRGNVGIGTATPSAKLHIKAGGAEILIDDDGDVEFKFS